jgi:hypothetical protein
MNPLLSALSPCARFPREDRVPTGHIRNTAARKLRARPVLHILEDRVVPPAFPVADVTVRGGPTSTGILDPSGAGAVGINRMRDTSKIRSFVTSRPVYYSRRPASPGPSTLKAAD